MSETNEPSKNAGKSEGCQMHEPLMKKLDRAIEGLIRLETSLPLCIAEISQTLRDLRSMIIDKTELLFKLDKEKQEKIGKLETEIALLKDQKMPPRLFRLETWQAKAIGGLAVAVQLATFGLVIWGVLRK